MVKSLREVANGLAVGFAAAAMAFGLPVGLALVSGLTRWSSTSIQGWAYVVGLAAAAGFEAVMSSGVRAEPSPQDADRSRTMTTLATLTGLIVLATAMAALTIPASPPRPAIMATGGGLVLIGLALRVAAMHRLGARFRSDNATPADSAPEDGGLFRWLAHPSEVGLVALGLGGLFLVPSALFLSLLAVVFGLQTWRLYLEEKALFTRYGRVYLNYRQRTWDPLPSVFLIVGGRHE